MLQVWVDVVYLDEAEFKRLVDERRAKPVTSTTDAGPRAEQRQ
jgi:hypothetical protein